MKTRSVANYLCLPLTWLIVSLFYAGWLITDSSAPGGDGSRVIRYIEAAAESGLYLPLWNPFVTAGTPGLADPEWLFYTLLAPAFQLFPQDLYNLAFNVLLLLAILLHNSVLYFLGRSLGLTPVFSLVLSVSVSSSDLILTHVLSGRINTLIVLSASLLLIPLYRRWLESGSNLVFVVLTLLSGFSTCFMGYYILPLYLVLFIVAWCSNMEHRRGIAGPFLRSVGHLIMIGIGGILACALFIFPQINYQLSTLVSSGWNVLPEMLSGRDSDKPPATVSDCEDRATDHRELSRARGPGATRSDFVYFQQGVQQKFEFGNFSVDDLSIVTLRCFLSTAGVFQRSIFSDTGIEPNTLWHKLRVLWLHTAHDHRIDRVASGILRSSDSIPHLESFVGRLARPGNSSHNFP